jgi:glycoside/pentoside/hexuronide:cation symporter, GPH family
VVLPNHYATVFGLPLAALGALLLGARLLDAVADPWIGRWADAWFARGVGLVLGVAAAAAVVLAAGFYALFFPPAQATQSITSLLVWCGFALAVTYLSFSVLSVIHQAWGARLGGDASQRARTVAWREGLALAGVLMASVLPSVAGLGVTSLAFAVLLLLGWALLRQAPRPEGAPTATPAPPLGLPFRNPAFRHLLALFLVNGVASAIPATLVLFFIRDRLQLPQWEPAFLVAYFLAGALSMPLWVRAVPRFGLTRCWLAGMLLAVAAFVWAAGLGRGDALGYLAVCIASGLALGADLALPSALLAGVIQRAGHAGHAEGAYFGWWNFAIKLNLALAAGLALPLLGWAGYTPGQQDEASLNALTVAYCLLPCVLKLVAAALAGWAIARHNFGEPR